ncbi:RDD family protein [Streptomyces specialis]|uniref:RDD family protein n=1 Tax=Streptomyces specialis TaxID=498367 RepID=UPI00099E5268|nr:RDD family protein [Streptomyces specialis]
MSSPTAGSPPTGSAGGGPGPNWYPDPSIPGYIRYWNGSAWVPGSSRPEPKEGEPVPTPPSGAAAPQAAPAPAVPAAREETQPFFFDEDPPAAAEPAPSSGDALPELRRRGDVAPVARQEPGGAWRADAGRQSGFGADQRVTWGSDEDVSTSPVAAAGRVDPRGQFRRTPVEGSQPPRRTPESGPPEPVAGEDTAALRLPPGGSWERQVRELAEQPPSGPAQQPVPPRQSSPPQGVPVPPAPPAPSAVPPRAQAQPAVPQPPVIPQPVPQQSVPQQSVPQQSVPPQAAPPQPVQQQAVPPQAVPPQAQPPQSAPGYGYPQPQSGPAPGGYGYPQAQAPQPSQSPFLQSHQGAPLTMIGAFTDPGQAYPAGLWRRLMARVVDSLLPVAAAVAVALPLVGKARDHIDAQIEAAERAGVTERVWLVDGTTGGYLALVIGVFLGVTLLLEALPTAFWGRTPGKALFKLRVLDVERQDKPTFGAALLRWLVYHLLSLFVVGLVSLLWGVRDRPWRQAWHDKATHTFVAGTKRPD